MNAPMQEQNTVSNFIHSLIGDIMSKHSFEFMRNNHLPELILVQSLHLNDLIVTLPVVKRVTPVAEIVQHVPWVQQRNSCAVIP